MLVQEELAAHIDSDAAPQAEGLSTSEAAEDKEQQGTSNVAEEEERQGINAASEASISQVIIVLLFPCQSKLMKLL